MGTPGGLGGLRRHHFMAQSLARSGAMVRQHYRGLLRAMHITFRNDAEMLHGSRAEARREIFKHSAVPDPAEIEVLCKGMDEVAEFLLTQVVQQELQTDGTYRQNIEKRQ